MATARRVIGAFTACAAAVALAACDKAVGDDFAGTGGTGAAGAAGGAGTASPSGGTGAGGQAISGGAAAGTTSAGAGGTTPGGAGLSGKAGGGAGGASGSAGRPSAGAGGGSTAGGPGAAGGGGMTPGIDACGAPPAATPDSAVVAINTENTLRVAMGLDCATIAPPLILSAQAHCDYYTQNQGTDCEAPSPHDEIEGCPGFTGAGLGDRFKAAGYMLRGGGSECMAFLDDPANAVITFVNSVYHRTPVLDPWMRDFGYGGSDSCDTIDFGTGTMSASTLTAVYPYADQTGLPTSFDGSREGPEPPMPTSGWPSGYPVTLYAKSFSATAHSITVDGDATELAHQWLAESDTTLPDYAKVLYTDAPLSANTKYHVVITGTLSGADKTFDWRFTTGAATGGGRPRPGN